MADLVPVTILARTMLDRILLNPGERVGLSPTLAREAVASGWATAVHIPLSTEESPAMKDVPRPVAHKMMTKAAKSKAVS